MIFIYFSIFEDFMSFAITRNALIMACAITHVFLPQVNENLVA